MKLFVTDIQTNKKIYLDLQFNSRRELANNLGSYHFIIHGLSFSVNDVFAESDEGGLTAGAIIGGVIGLIAGPGGAIVGGTLGGLLGNSNDKDERNKVQRFNNSVL